MKTHLHLHRFWLAVLLVGLGRLQAGELITNGGFETGLSGWTVANQLGSEGTFFAQSGTLSPVNGFVVPAPPQGFGAAMTDAMGPGSHVLYQDFVVTSGGAYALSFSLFVGNGNGAPNFYTPPTLDFSTPALNQRARVDIMTTSSNPFSLAPGDVLLNVFETAPGSSLTFGYLDVSSIDVTSLFQAHQGSTLRLRFTDVDNVAPMNVGIDRVSIITSVPDNLPWLVTWGAIAGMLALGARRRQCAR